METSQTHPNWDSGRLPHLHDAHDGRLDGDGTILLHALLLQGKASDEEEAIFLLGPFED